MNLRYALLVGLLLPLLAGCGGDDGGGGPGSGPDATFLSIFNQDPNSDSVEYGDPGPLESDIDSLFGGSNDDPQEPEDVLN